MPPAKTPASAKVPAALRRPQIGATTSVQAPATRASQKDVQATSKKTQSVDGASGVRGGRLGTKEKEGQTKTASEEGAEQEKGGKPGAFMFQVYGDESACGDGRETAWST